jgi:hypothetical protein
MEFRGARRHLPEGAPARSSMPEVRRWEREISLADARALLLTSEFPACLDR